MVVASYNELVKLGFYRAKDYRTEKFPDFLGYERNDERGRLFLLMEHVRDGIYYGHAARDVHGNSLSTHESDIERELLLDETPINKFLENLQRGLKLEQKV